MLKSSDIYEIGSDSEMFLFLSKNSVKFLTALRLISETLHGNQIIS